MLTNESQQNTQASNDQNMGYIHDSDEHEHEHDGHHVNMQWNDSDLEEEEEDSSNRGRNGMEIITVDCRRKNEERRITINNSDESDISNPGRESRYNEKEEKKYCHFFNNWECTRRNCRFVHEVAPECEVYATKGYCNQRVCQFSHPDCEETEQYFRDRESNRPARLPSPSDHPPNSRKPLKKAEQKQPPPKSRPPTNKPNKEAPSQQGTNPGRKKMQEKYKKGNSNDPQPPAQEVPGPKLPEKSMDQMNQMNQMFQMFQTFMQSQMQPPSRLFNPQIQQPPPQPNWYQYPCLLYTSPSPRDLSTSRMPSSA